MPVNILKTKQNKTKERGIFNWNVLGLAAVMRLRSWPRACVKHGKLARHKTQHMLTCVGP